MVGDVGGLRDKWWVGGGDKRDGTHGADYPLTVAVAREPILMTLSGHLRTVSLKILMSFLVHIEAGIKGGILAISWPERSHRTNFTDQHISRPSTFHYMYIIKAINILHQIILHSETCK